MSTSVPARLRGYGLPNAATLYILASQSGLQETGSSSIGVQFTDACAAVVDWMRTQHGVHSPDNEQTKVMQLIGDPSVAFYFRGWIDIEGEHKKIFLPTYLELLSADATGINPEHRQDFDSLCEALAKSIQTSMQPKEDVVFYRTTKDGSGGFRVPPEAYHHHMTDDELEPFRMSKEEETERFGWMF